MCGPVPGENITLLGMTTLGRGGFTRRYAWGGVFIMGMANGRFGRIGCVCYRLDGPMSPEMLS